MIFKQQLTTPHHTIKYQSNTPLHPSFLKIRIASSHQLRERFREPAVPLIPSPIQALKHDNRHVPAQRPVLDANRLWTHRVVPSRLRAKIIHQLPHVARAHPNHPVIDADPEPRARKNIKIRDRHWSL